jgi:hypothetical protein
VSTLDDRIWRDCARSGVPFHVEDEALLDRVAVLIDGTDPPERQRRPGVSHRATVSPSAAADERHAHGTSA